MNSSSLKENCLNAFALKTVYGGLSGFSLSLILGFKRRRAFTILGGGIGGGLSSYECEALFKRFKLSDKLQSS